MLPRWVDRFVKSLLILAPPLLIGILIFKNGVDTPVLDQWDGTAPIFEKMQDGTLGVADFFVQHNEHRIFFPRLIFFALGRLTHWNIRTELWVVWLLALVCLFSIRQMAGPSRTGGFARVSPTGRERETTGSRAVAEQRPE